MLVAALFAVNFFLEAQGLPGFWLGAAGSRENQPGPAGRALNYYYTCTPHRVVLLQTKIFFCAAKVLHARQTTCHEIPLSLHTCDSRVPSTSHYHSQLVASTSQCIVQPCWAAQDCSVLLTTRQLQTQARVRLAGWHWIAFLGLQTPPPPHTA